MAADAEGYLLDGGERVPAALKVWAAGIRASDSFNESGLELDRAGQTWSAPTCWPRVISPSSPWATAPAWSRRAADDHCPSTAQVANQQALHLIRHLPAWLRSGKPVPPFRYRDLGALVSLSDYNAFGRLGRSGSSKAASSRAGSRS